MSILKPHLARRAVGTGLWEPYSNICILYENSQPNFVDDISVYSNEFDHHLADLEEFLSGFTLNLKKCKFAQSHVKYVGHIIGCGERKPDPDQVATVKDMKVPETKWQVRRLIGFFSYFRDLITLKILTDPDQVATDWNR